MLATRKECLLRSREEFAINEKDPFKYFSSGGRKVNAGGKKYFLRARGECAINEKYLGMFFFSMMEINAGRRKVFSLGFQEANCK